MGDTNKNLVDGGVSNTKVYIAPIKSIISYQIIEEELEQVESGFDGGICLNIAIACISASISLCATVSASSFEQGSSTKPVLWTLAIVLFAFFIVFLGLYFSSRKKSRAVFTKIRSRKSDIPLPTVQKPDNIQQTPIAIVEPPQITEPPIRSKKRHSLQGNMRKP